MLTPSERPRRRLRTGPKMGLAFKNVDIGICSSRQLCLSIASAPKQGAGSCFTSFVFSRRPLCRAMKSLGSGTVNLLTRCKAMRVHPTALTCNWMSIDDGGTTWILRSRMRAPRLPVANMPARMCRPDAPCLGVRARRVCRRHHFLTVSLASSACNYRVIAYDRRGCGEQQRRGRRHAMILPLRPPTCKP